MIKFTTEKTIKTIIYAGCILLTANTYLNAATTGESTDKAQIQAAAKVYNCSEKEAEKMLKNIRPEMRGAFLSGKLRPKNSAKPTLKISTAKPAPEKPSRREMIETMKHINKQAKDHNWSEAKASAVRRTYVRRFVNSSLTLEELKKWVNNPQALPKIKQPSK